MESKLRENEDYAPQFDELASLVDELSMKGHATSDITYETIITRALRDPLYTFEEMRTEWSTWLSTLSVSKKQHKWSFEKWWEEMQEKALDIDRIKERERQERAERGKGAKVHAKAAKAGAERVCVFFQSARGCLKGKACNFKHIIL